MLEKIFSFFLKFLLLSALLFVLWLWKLNTLYQNLFVGLVNVFSGMLGTNLGLPIPSEFFHNLIPFTALMLVTFGLIGWRRLWLLILGWLILLLQHLLVGVYIYLLLDILKLSGSTYISFFTPLPVLSGIFPFVLWFLLLREDVKMVLAKPAHSRSPK